MESQFFRYKETTLHFLKSGNGSKVVFAFHGFGQDRSIFSKLSQRFDNQYTVYSFDLFFHGKSEWNKDEVPLEKTFWKDLLITFLHQERINRFSLVGFSMGAKFALASLEAFPEKVDTIILLAPDGIKTSLWYNVATYPLMLRKLFKSMISKPNRFYAIARVAHTIRVIDKGLLRFVDSQMNTEVKRNRVYLSWVVFRHLHFNMNTIAQAINTNKIHLTIIAGRYDKIITAKSMFRLLHKLDNPNLVILETGHNEIVSKWLNAKNQNDIPG